MSRANPVHRGSGVARILLVFVAVVSLGMPDGLLGVAWPSVRDAFSRPLDSLGALLLAFTAGYLTSSSLSGYAIARAGVAWLLAGSCALTGLSLIGYTLAPGWGTLVGLAVATGLGAGAIDGGINTYVASPYGERLMHWLHASWGIGITLGPLVMTTGLERFHSWRWGYVVVGAAQIGLGAFFACTLPLWRDPPASHAADHEKPLIDFRTPLADTLRHPPVWGSVLLFFLFSGAEATAGMWTYTLLTESRGMAPKVAGILVGAYWASFTLGRIVAGLYAARLGTPSVIRYNLAGAGVAAALYAWNPSWFLGHAGLLLLGLFIAPIFPGLVSGTSERVGRRDAANTIGLQIGAAGLGAALIPGLAGTLARRSNLEIVPLYLVALVAFLLALDLGLRRFCRATHESEE
ncbi:MAG: MFS transporter [Verrucomicrobiales bacterium]|nr:MFS transporter [Verrucomicrobiales bacterium]